MRGKILGVTFVTAAFTGCMGNAKYGALGAACPQLIGSGDPLRARYSKNARADVKVKTFVAASRDLAEVSVQMEGEAREACRRMALDLGVSEAELEPRRAEPGASAQAACGALAARIDAILQRGAFIRVSAEPPACSANAEARAECSGVCDATVDPGEIIARCEPGKLAGHCRGSCHGSCDGTCRGQCEGQCTAQNAAGNCMGRCEGKCHGSCDATCRATCEGQWEAPRCEGQLRGPSIDAECQASCNARAEFRAQCTPARVAVQADQNVEDVARLAATLQANLPLLLHAEVALGRRLLASAETVVRVGAELPRVIGEAGAEAVACTAAAASASATATARIRVSVQASASVSGRVTAG